ncbi:hypothetical protein [Nonomuraea cavernae]|uniref:hypothetical protein n=1 Tax=Nonomuraea cavernae TaxID=2045107 RepID=UPI0033C1C24A
MGKTGKKGLPQAVVALAALIGTLFVTGQPAWAGEYDREPEVTCTSEQHPQFADQMADFIRIAVNVGTVVRLEGLREPGVAFYDHVTGTECYSTTEQFFETGSLVKASILGALLHRPQDLSAAERPLVEKMILESDNDTSLRLWRESLGCGKDDSGTVRPCDLFRAFLEAADMENTYPDDEGAFGDTHTTARDQVRLFRLFSAPNQVINETRRGYALDLLRRAEPRYGVPSFAPPGTTHALKVGFSKLGGSNHEWRTNVAGYVSGGNQGYDYVTAFLSDRNEEVEIPGPYDWPFNGIKRLNKVAEQVNCGIRELNGDNTCWDFENEDCFISSPDMECRTDHPLRSHRSQHWVRVDIGAKLGSTVHWKLVDAANGIVVDEGDAVGGPNCVCDKTVYGLYGSYILKLNTSVANGGDRGAIFNHTGGPQDPDPDQPPVVSAGPDRTGAEGQAIELTGLANDDKGTPAVHWSVEPGPDVDAGASCSFSAPTATRTTVTCDDDGTFTLKLSAYDGVNAAVGDEARLELTNVAPATETPRAARAASAVTPQPWQVFRAGATVSLSVPFTDPGGNDTHTCLTDWDDGTTSTHAADGLTCQDSHVYTRPGMFTIKTEVTDDDTGSGGHEVMVIVYDPDAGFGTQGGWLTSPAGSVTADPPATGKGHFQANVKYLPHDQGPEPGNGKVSFRVTPAGFDLDSTSLEWLVVTPDDRIAVKGTGSVDGRPGYGFVQYSYDADPDRVRLVVWPLTAGAYPTDTLTYDNVRGAGFDLDVARPQEIAHGSVVAHN